eukprot:360819-Chlamydomonas_euryale.AAC.8
MSTQACTHTHSRPHLRESRRVRRAVDAEPQVENEKPVPNWAHERRRRHAQRARKCDPLRDEVAVECGRATRRHNRRHHQPQVARRAGGDGRRLRRREGRAAGGGRGLVGSDQNETAGGGRGVVGSDQNGEGFEGCGAD